MELNKLNDTIKKFFNWPDKQEFNISTLGEYLKASWLKILLFILVLFALIWLTKKIIEMFKSLSD